MSEQSILFIDDAPFLGRIEEQQRFRDALRQVMQENSIAAKAKNLLADQDMPLPFVFLLYGEGGMGKSTLAKQLLHITTTEAEFKGHFETLWLDWESRKQIDIKLVARNSVSPETVFEHIYAIFRDANFGKEFDAYEKALTTRAEAEKKVAQALDSTVGEGRDRYAGLRELGAQGLAWLVRSGIVTGTSPLPIPQEPTAKAFEAVLGGGAEAIARARETANTLLRARLNPDEFDLFTLPNETLARKLADGIWKASQKRPIVLTLDTYEIADRADVWLRVVIKRAGPNVIWVIAGRDNLAESRKYGQGYQPGYRADFTSDRLRVFSMDEFSVSDVAEYFKYRVPERPLDKITAQTIHRAALGIPLAVKEAAAIWQNPAKTLSDIIGDDGGDGAPNRDRDKIVQTMTERFLLHCWDDPKDLVRLYALALAYQPDADLLSAMLDTPDLEAELSVLERRHSFVFVTEMKLHDKVGIWIREYLQAEVHRKRKNVRDLHQRAVQHLRERLKQQETLLPLLENRVSEERWTTDTVALTHHSFWLDEVQGWAVLLPAFVGGLGYSRDFARALLDAAQSLTRTLSKTGQRRLKALRAGLQESSDAMQQSAALDELESTQQAWPTDGNEAERQIILDLQCGRLLYQNNKYLEALARYEQAAQRLPETTQTLRRQLSHELSQVSSQFIWPEGSGNSQPTEAGLRASELAVSLDASNRFALFNYAVTLLGVNRTSEAIAGFQRAIELDPMSASPHDGLGGIYSALGHIEKAFSEYQRAIELNPKYASAHANLGDLYYRMGRTADAIAEYQCAIELEPKFAFPHSGLGTVYAALGRTDDAITEYQHAIELAPKYADPHNGLGNVYHDLGRTDEALTEYQRAIGLDPKFASQHNRLGVMYQSLGQLEKALDEYAAAVELDPQRGMYRSSLVGILKKLGRAAEAAEQEKIARELTAKETEYNRACFEAICGNADEALTLLKSALEKKQISLTWVRRDPDFESLRSDPRFIALIGEADERPSVDAAPSE